MLMVVRHADVGDKRGWDGPDLLRPLSPSGHRQAEGLVVRREDSPGAAPGPGAVQLGTLWLLERTGGREVRGRFLARWCSTGCGPHDKGATDG